jgi:PAS domain S-box-containing protein
VISLLVAALGLLVLCGWAFNVPALIYIRPSFQSTKVNTALSFLCLGAGLWLTQDEKWERSRRILGLSVVIIAGLTLAEYIFQVSLGIDQLLFRDTRSPSLSAYPGRMAIGTAICLVFLGLAVMFLGLKKAQVLQRSLVVVCFALSVVALCGYVYGVHSLYSITTFSTMGLQTAAGLFATCLAYFLARPDEGIVSIAANESDSGFLMRALVPSIIIVPILIGWLTLAGERASLYDTPFGVALQVLGSIGCLIALTMLIARSMNGLERERSRAEKLQLRDTAIVESSDDAIAGLDINGVITNWNRGAERLFGYTASEAIGENVVFLSPPDARDDANDVLNKVWQGEVVKSHETVRRRRDGTSVAISLTVSPIVDSRGQIVGASGIAHDITESKRAEQALHEMNRALEEQAAMLQSSEELLKIFVKNVPAAVAMLDREMRYLQVSDRWCSDNSVKASELLGRSREELPEMPERWKEFNRRALQGETLRAEEDCWESGGSTRWNRWEVRPWKTSEGNVGGILIFAEDITHRKQMEEALSGMSRKLIEAQEQERARIARELHDDITQRLAMLSVELDLLKENPSEIDSRVQELRRQTTELSNDVQAISHDLHSSQLEYLGAVAGMSGWCKEFAERQGIRIDWRQDVQSALPAEIGLCLFRVLQEALHNAIKHGGAKRVDVELHEESDEIHLIVSDSGRGFDVNSVKQGKGLGLTSMGERVRLVNGKISIESKPMAGTTVHVRVPLESEKLSERAVG